MAMQQRRLRKRPTSLGTHQCWKAALWLLTTLLPPGGGIQEIQAGARDPLRPAACLTISPAQPTTPVEELRLVCSSGRSEPALRPGARPEFWETPLINVREGPGIPLQLPQAHGREVVSIKAQRTSPAALGTNEGLPEGMLD